jgi:hypothetical protein
MGFRVTEKEQELIRKRMKQTNISNLRAYLLKQAIDGYVVNLDLTNVTECSRLLHTISNNINQIAKHANTVGAVSIADMESIKISLERVWEQQNEILKSLAKILETV